MKLRSYVSHVNFDLLQFFFHHGRLSPHGLSSPSDDLYDGHSLSLQALTSRPPLRAALRPRRCYLSVPAHPELNSNTMALTLCYAALRRELP